MAAKKPKNPPSAAAEVATPEASPSVAAPFPDLSGMLEEDEGADEEAARRKPGTLITLNPERIATLQKKGIDVRIAKIRIEKTSEEGRKQRVPGEFPPDAVTVEFIMNRWGPGYYEVKGVNAGGMYIGGSSVHVDGVPEIARANGTGAPQPNGAAPALTFQEQLLMALIARPPPPREEDSMRDAIASMVKLMTLQMTQQQMQAAMVAQSGAGQSKGGLDSKVLELLERALRPEKQENGFAQFLPLLQMGVNIGRGMAGGTVPNPEGDMPPWMRIVPELADTVGVPLVVTFAQALLGPEKAKDVVEAIQNHDNARRAEAEAEAAHAAKEEP